MRSPLSPTSSVLPVPSRSRHAWTEWPQHTPSPAAQVGCGTVLAGRYRLSHLLGRGAMGRVYRAEDQHLGRSCAVKMLHNAATCEPHDLRRFRNEAVAISRLCHPNLVEVYDFLTDDSGRSYLIMELLDGVDLHAQLQTCGRLPTFRAVEIILPVAHALHCAHQLGIVHRDIKPRNLFLKQQPRIDGSEMEVVKVIDFGLAKMQGAQQQTEDGLILGTPEYLAPEATLGRSEEVDARTDQWALAVTLYRLLSGRLPFEDEDVVQLLLKIRTAPPPPIQQFVPDLPTPVASTIMRALSKRKDDRFSDLLAFSHALTMDGRPAGRIDAAPTRERPVSPGDPNDAVEPTRSMPEHLLRSLLAQVGDLHNLPGNDPSHEASVRVDSPLAVAPAQPAAPTGDLRKPTALLPARKKSWLAFVQRAGFLSSLLLVSGTDLPAGSLPFPFPQPAPHPPQDRPLPQTPSPSTSRPPPVLPAPTVHTVTPPWPARNPASVASSAAKKPDRPQRPKEGPPSNHLPSPSAPRATPRILATDPSPGRDVPSAQEPIVQSEDQASTPNLTGRPPVVAIHPPTVPVDKATPRWSPLHRISGDDPRLPLFLRNTFRGQRLVATYRICVETSGAVRSVTPLQSLPIGDEHVLRTLLAWRYRPISPARCTDYEAVFDLER